MIKQMTSQEANKLLKRLEDKLQQLVEKERRCATYSEFHGSNTETPICPAVDDYSFSKTRAEISKYNMAIRSVKHCINLFNVTQTLPDTGLTIDAALVYMAQLNQEKRRLDDLRNREKKSVRAGMAGRSTAGFIEVTVTNYDPADAAVEYESASRLLDKIIADLDHVNTTEKFTVDTVVDIGE